jgi:hypothetical protein
VGAPAVGRLDGEDARLTYLAAAGTASAIAVTRGPAGVEVRDPGGIAATFDCRQDRLGDAVATCPVGSLDESDWTLGDGDDRLSMAGIPRRPSARRGEARVKAGAGDDVVISGGTADTLAGEAGDDRLEGGAGADEISGGAGRDRLVLGPDVDTADAGAGADVVDARDGSADTVDCGSGTDRLLADWLDAAVPSCERLRRGDTSPRAAVGARIASGRVRVDTRGRLFLRVTCPSSAGAGCAGGAALVRGQRQVAVASMRVRAGRSGEVRFDGFASADFFRSIRRELFCTGRAPARAVAVTEDGLGRTRTAAAPAMIVAPRFGVLGHPANPAC